MGGIEEQGPQDMERRWLTPWLVRMLSSDNVGFVPVPCLPVSSSPTIFLIVINMDRGFTFIIRRQQKVRSNHGFVSNCQGVAWCVLYLSHCNYTMLPYLSANDVLRQIASTMISRSCCSGSKISSPLLPTSSTAPVTLMLL